jgi:hypothetical protein
MLSELGFPPKFKVARDQACGSVVGHVRALRTHTHTHTHTQCKKPQEKKIS